MIREFLSNINERKVLIEKYPESLEEEYFGLEFQLPKSKRKSILKVKFSTFEGSIFPNIKGDVSTDKSGQFVMSFDPFEIQICSSKDDNSSYEFVSWIEKFISNEPYSGGANIKLFNQSFSERNIIIILNGCVVEDFIVKEGHPIVLIKFFSYQFPGGK